ncbi:MAG: hypothetical protein IIU43_13830 [Thermoguttaceae bacterium]|nr:hypothetical protein [Thermoguttaceae bacterium]
MELKLYKSASGELAVALLNAGSQTAFGAEPMTEVIPGTTDAAVEKHVPVAAVDGNKVAVTVGSVEHPMTPAHYIEWIAIKTKRGVAIRTLEPETPPKAEFTLEEGDKLVDVYAYCNLHSLWKA